MSIGGKLAFFLGGALFGSVGLKALSGKEAKKACAHVTAAALRAKDQIMKQVDLVQENCSDILADAKQINAARVGAPEAEYIGDSEEE